MPVILLTLMPMLRIPATLVILVIPCMCHKSPDGMAISLA